jgi:ubiquinone/menaquinone biosynthesis C-methylase UbiE
VADRDAAFVGSVPQNYDQFLGPLLFHHFADDLAGRLAVKPGLRVLETACGTGILTERLARRLAGQGTLGATDLNEPMIAHARTKALRDVDWRQADATALPFDDGSFDAVLCQSALMFFPDATQALREMGRVCRPGGVIGVQVYSSLDAQPAYGPWVEMVARYAGPEAISLLSTYWAHGDLDVLTKRFEAAGLDVTGVRTRLGSAKWDSVDDLVQTEIGSTPLVDRISDDVQRRILASSHEVLDRFGAGHGLEVPMEGHLVIARKG